MRKSFLLLMSIFATTNAFAMPLAFSNFYIDGFGGANFVNSQKVIVNDLGSSDKLRMRLDLNTGYAVGGAIGYKFSRFIRLEAEAAYRANTYNQMVVEAVQIPISGGIKTVSAMVNGLIDLPFLCSSLTPYCGLGLGESWTHTNMTVEPIFTPEVVIIFDKLVMKNFSLAYQGIAGLSYDIGPKLQAAIEYRYLGGLNSDRNHTLDIKLQRFF